MKKIVSISIFTFLVFTAFAQEDDFRTIFSGQPVRISGFGGPFMNFTVIDGEFAHMMGGGGGVMLNDFFIGGYGLGLTNSLDAPQGYNYPDTYELQFGHGGFWLGYSFFGNRAIHPVVHVQTGWGQIQLTEDYNPVNQDNVFVLSPTLELEANFTSFFRMSVGARYRLVQNGDAWLLIAL